MKKEIYVEPLEDTSNLVINTPSTFYRLYEVEGSNYNRFSDVEVFKNRESGITHLYVDGWKSDLSFEGYLNELSETYEIELDYRIQDEVNFVVDKNDHQKPSVGNLASNSLRHDGPVKIDRYDNGSLTSTIWRNNGRLHREDGPAEIYYDEEGDVEVEAYHINGKELSKSEFEKSTKAIKQAEISPLSKSSDKPKYKGPSL